CGILQRTQPYEPWYPQPLRKHGKLWQHHRSFNTRQGDSAERAHQLLISRFRFGRGQPDLALSVLRRRLAEKVNDLWTDHGGTLIRRQVSASRNHVHLRLRNQFMHPFALAQWRDLVEFTPD